MEQGTLERIWAVIAAIPEGSTLSYGEVARRAGLPQRARLAARALREAPEALGLPWHRVVNAQGGISIPDPETAAEQRRRLAAEGVRLVRGRVAAEHLDQPADLDELLWAPPVGDG